MSEASAVNRASAFVFLSRFPNPIRRRGQAYFANGAVKRLDEEVPGECWTADVDGSEQYHVTLLFDPDRQEWDAECECLTVGLCKHACAALLTLISRNPTPNAAATAKPAARTTSRPEPVLTLPDAAQDVLGRKLSSAEKETLAQIRRMYRGLGTLGEVSIPDLRHFGWTPETLNFGTVRISTSRIRSELEFWHCLAAYAAAEGFPVPPFLQSIAIPPEILQRAQAIHRAHAAEQWQRVLASLPEPTAPAESAAQVEFRVRLEPTEAILETRTGEGPWRRLRPTFASAHSSPPELGPRPEAQLIWSSFTAGSVVHYGHSLAYQHEEVVSTLGRLLATPAFRPLLVQADGSPLVFHEEPLHWSVREPEDPSEDYQFSLSRADGSPAPTSLFVAPGHPPLHVTSEGVFAGPPRNPATQGKRKFAIPAAVFESRSGLHLLRWLQAPLPARLAARVRTVHLRPHIRAEILIDAYFQSTEYCILQVQAKGPRGEDPHILNQFHWYPKSSRRADAAGDLTNFDRSLLHPIPQLVQVAGFKPHFPESRYRLRVTKKFPDQFLAFLKSLPEQVDLELRGELASLLNPTVAGTFNLEIEESGIDWFDLKVLVNVNDTTLTQEEISLLIHAKGGWVRLGKKGWRRLEYALSTEANENLARLGLNPHQLDAEPQRLHALQLSDPVTRQFLSTDTCDRIERRVSEIRMRVSPPQPAAVGATLRPYQTEGFHFLAYLSANRFGGILADDMGLGKTLQTLTWLAWLRTEQGSSEERALPSLVVCPKSVQDNWRAEAERFYPDLSVRIWSGVGLKNMPSETGTAALHVINYAQLRSIGDALGRVDFLAVVLDEGQNIKSPSSITTQHARRLRAAHRLILTGTPIENRLLDLWSLFSFAMPGVLGNRAAFGRLYDATSDPLARQRLAARVRPFLLRRTKSQVARDLPDRVEEDLYCEFEGEQQMLYAAELKRTQQMLLRLKTPDAFNKERFNVLTSLLRLRQICCHPALVLPETKVVGAKLEALLETLEPLIEEGEKVIVFSQFVEALNLVQTEVLGRDWTCWKLTGDTENRGDLVREFQSHSGAGVFLISLKAGGAGLNLTAASYVVLFDPWWNPAVENQAIDRTHRIGQTRKIIAYRILIKGTIEEKIRQLQKQKAALAQDILGEERFAQSLTLSDLRFLLDTP